MSKKVSFNSSSFKQGTTFENKKQRVQTPKVNLLFELTKKNTAIYENKKAKS